jgi:hypothetical protein
MVEACLNAGLPGPFQLEEFFDQAEGPGVTTGRIRAGSADGLENPWLTPLGIKTQDPAGQSCSAPSRVKVTVPSRT